MLFSYNTQYQLYGVFLFFIDVRIDNYNSVIMASKDQKLEFVLFLDPSEKQFYSYCAAKGLIVKEEEVPLKIKMFAQNQIQDLAICLEDIEFKEISSFQRRPIPLSVLTQRKFKYPVYYTQQHLPASSLQSLRVNELGKVESTNLNDFIKAKIYLGELQMQLERSKKGEPPNSLTIDIKLIASVNEVIRTLNRVILQDYGVVITMRNSVNKLIFKVKDKNEYLYGNESIANFQFIRQSLNDKKDIELQILQVSIYDKEQLMKYIFQRNADEVAKGVYSSFPWDQLLQNNIEENQFFMWYVPDDYFTHPESFIDLQKLYSTSELIRTNEKIKLKIEEKKRLHARKIARFMWKEKIGEFLQKRKNEIKNRYIQIDGNIIYSGECFFAFEFKVLSISNLFALFNQTLYENKITRKRFLKFQSKQMFNQVGNETKFPSLETRYMKFVALKNKKMIDLIPFMLNINIMFVVGCNELYSTDTKFVIADNNQIISHKVSWGSLSKMPLETTIVFKVQIYAKEGDGVTCGVGALKLFDQNGYLRQGQQEVQLYAKQRIELFKIGCIDHLFSDEETIARIKIKLPSFKNNVIWTLADQNCSKMLGYLPISQTPTSKELNLERLNELLRFDPIAIRYYNPEDRELLRKCKKYYKHQSEKLINYLFAIDWCEPAQVAEVYTTLTEWAPPKPIEALFLLNPSFSDQKVRYYAVKRLQNFLDYQFVLYSNQITQALVSFQTHNNPLIQLILEKCVYEPFSIAVEYFWQFKNRIEQEFTYKRFQLYLESLCMVSSFRKEFVKQVRVNNYLIEMNEGLVKDTQNYKQFKDKNSRFKELLPAISRTLNQICPEGFLFPIRPQYVFNALKQSECKMYDSKKLPFSLACLPNKDYAGESYKVMFKYGDDLKQDNLILQIFRIFDKLWRENGLDLKMSIYRTLSTGNQIGFIQIVDAQNNSKIHKDYGKGIVQALDQRSTLLFLEAHNNKKNIAIAKQNYIRSSAGYLVATYVMGIGDRHSGNVMVQKNGKFFHIDFGHILGNFKTKFNIKRERTPVVFTSEYLYVMGGLESHDFKRFQEFASKAFNILRKNSSTIINLLAMMVSAEIPQLRRLSDINYVIEKLVLDLSEAQAAQNLVNTIKETLLSQKSRNIDNAFHEANRQG